MLLDMPSPEKQRALRVVFLVELLEAFELCPERTSYKDYVRLAEDRPNQQDTVD